MTKEVAPDVFGDPEVVRSERATKPRVEVDLHGMKVVIPKGMNLTPEELIERKRDWIERKKKEMEALRERIPDREFKEGATWPYQGDGHFLQVKATGTSEISDGNIVLAERAVEEGSVKEALEAFYRNQARGFIRGVLDAFADRIGVEFNTFRIKNQKTLWGSCSSKNNLNFNWRLMMAPPDVAEYVVLHELCHLREPNHSERFWSLLSQYCDGPRQKARWLKEHAVELIFTEEDL